MKYNRQHMTRKGQVPVVVVALPFAYREGVDRYNGIMRYLRERDLDWELRIVRETLSVEPLSVSDISVPATVWASSLDGLPVEDSSRILLTHLTNVQNSGTAYEDASLRKLVAWGKLPHLMQDGTCRISLALSSSAHVYALAADGTRMAEIQSRYADGRLAFTAKTNANPQNAIFLYEIVRH